MLASENLNDEHKVILRMVKILLVASDNLEKEKAVSSALFAKAVDFALVFGDHCHYAKEESEFFPLLEKRGILKHKGPIAVMLMEHEQGRLFIKGLRKALNKYEEGNVWAKQTIIENARGYALLLDRHIYKEDSILFPMSDELLSEEDNLELLKKFKGIEKNIIGEGKHEYYLRMISCLEKKLGISEGEVIEHEH